MQSRRVIGSWDRRNPRYDLRTFEAQPRKGVGHHASSGVPGDQTELGPGRQCAPGNGGTSAVRPGLAEAGYCGTGPLSSKSDETERASASSTLSIGSRRILAGSSVAMPAS
jgi:hypothetical protein